MKEGYIDWIAAQTANAMGTDVTETKAALLGFAHDHDHTDPRLRAVSEEGCTLGGPEANDVMEGHALHDPSEKTERFTIDDASSATDLAFSVQDGDTTFTDYGVSHEKEMHLLIVRDDLRHFYHVHPERDTEGV